MMKPEQDKTLTVIIPCFNEKYTLGTCLEGVLKTETSDMLIEIIVVDDCSTDGSSDILRRLAVRHSQIKGLHHSRNRGKGAAIKTGIQKASGSIVTIQDADLECDPNDFGRLIQPILNNKADVVIGTRFPIGYRPPLPGLIHFAANKFLTFLSNIWTGLELTDMECCYKLFRRDFLQAFSIEEKRFGVEPELVAKAVRHNARIVEMPVSYHRRTYKDGKKIGLRDGVRAIYCIVRYNNFDLAKLFRSFFRLVVRSLSKSSTGDCTNRRVV